MTKPITFKNNSFDQWRQNTNENSNNIGDPAAIYSSDSTDTLIKVVTKVVVTAGGSGYTSVPNVNFSGGTPTVAAAATAIVENGVVVAIYITNHGYGYTGVPTVAIDAPSVGTQAYATAYIGLNTVGALNDLATRKFNKSGGTISGNTSVTGTLGVTSDFAINTNKFQVTGASGNTLIAGTLGVTGDSSLGSIITGTWNATAIADNKIASALTGKTYNALSLTAAATGFTIAGGTVSKTLTVNNTIGLSAANDTSTLNISTGGTLGTAAFTPSTQYAPAAGSTSIVTLGTITTGTWTAGVIASNYGGTGVNNAGRTLTINTNSGSLTFGAAGKTLTINNTIGLSAANDTSTLNISTGGTLGTAAFTAATDYAPAAGGASIITVGTITTGTWTAGVIGSTYGGTGVNNAGRTLTINTNSGTIAFSAASKTFTVANTLTLSGTDGSTLNVGTGGTLGTAAFTASTAYAPAAGSSSIVTVGTITSGTWSGTAIAINKGGTNLTTAPTQGKVLMGTSGSIYTLGDIEAADTTINVDTTVDGKIKIRVTGSTPGGSIPSLDDTNNAAVSYPLEILHTTTGVPSVGIGTGVKFTTEATAGNKTGSAIDSASTNVGSGTEAFDMIFRNMSSGTLGEVARIKSTGGISLVTGSTYQINNVDVLSATTLGAAVVNSSLTSVGTIATGTWNATRIADNKIASALTGKTYNSLSLTANATGFSVAGGTTSKTLTVSNSITLAGTDGTTITLPSTTGTVPLNNQTMYIGTTAVAINRASAALSLTGIDGVTHSSGVSGNFTVGSNLVVTGNLTISGTTTTTNSTTVTIDDPVFTLGGDTAPVADDNKDRGIEFRWHTGSAAKVGFFGFDDSTGRFTFIPDATNTSEVFSGSLGAIDVSAIYTNGTQISTSDLSNGTTGTGTIVLSGGPTLTGTVSLPSGTTKIGNTSLTQGGTVTITLPTVTGTLVGSGDTGTVTNTMLAGSIATSKITGLAASATTDTTNASNISTGTLADSRIASTLTGKTYNGLTLTALTTGFTIQGGATTSKTLTVNNSIGLSGVDTSTLDIGTGGTLGTAAFTASSAYAPAAGSSSIVTVGTIGSGTWQGGVIGSTYGGTGVNNAGRTLTINTNSGTLAFTNASTTLTIANTASVSGTNTGDQTTISGNAGSATVLATTRNIAITGDAAWNVNFNGGANVTSGITLATVNTNVGSFGSGSAIPVITVNAKGLITAVSTASVSIPSGLTAGSASTGFINYNGTTSTIGQMDGGTTAPTDTTRLNYNGHLYATKFFGDGSGLQGIAAGIAKYATSIGDGSNSSFTVTHNLNSADFTVTVRDLTSGYIVYPDVKYSSDNAIIVEFSTIPTTNQYRVVVAA